MLPSLLHLITKAWCLLVFQSLSCNKPWSIARFVQRFLQLMAAALLICFSMLDKEASSRVGEMSLRAEHEFDGALYLFSFFKCATTTKKSVRIENLFGGVKYFIFRPYRSVLVAGEPVLSLRFFFFSIY